MQFPDEGQANPFLAVVALEGVEEVVLLEKQTPKLEPI